MEYNFNQQFKYELKEWIPIFNSEPVALVASGDCSRLYEMNLFHIFKLANGNFALVRERGPIGFPPSGGRYVGTYKYTDIEILTDLGSAMEQFKNWENKMGEECPWI